MAVALVACGPPPVELVRADFGVIHVRAEGQPSFLPSRNVPYAVGQSYGWIAQVKTKQTKVKWKEEFTLPAAASTWGTEPGRAQVVSADRTTSVTEREVDAVGGRVYNFWSVAKGDPKGAYKMRVTVEGLDPIVFEFTVE